MSKNEGSEGVFQGIREWVSEHKLRTVGAFWATALATSFAYNFSRPHEKTSVKIIHARIHAQFLTLMGLAGAAAIEYYERNHGQKAVVALAAEPENLAHKH